MRLKTDDELHSISDVFLGAPGYTLPVRVRYRAWSVGFVTFLAVLAVQRWAGIGIGLASLTWALTITILATTALMRCVSPDRPLRGVAMTFWAEVSAPRAPTMTVWTFRPRRRKR